MSKISRALEFESVAIAPVAQIGHELTLVTDSFRHSHSPMDRPMNPAMNDTNWQELRAAMCALRDSPQWRNRIVGTGYESQWDSEWFYHFGEGGYANVEWIEIKVSWPTQREAVLAALREIHLPGHRTDNGFKIYGYLKPGQSVDYI